MARYDSLTIAEVVRRLERCEDAVRAAGELAVRLQGQTAVSRKFTSGNEAVDLVTEADRRVQEVVLTTFLNAGLSSCRVIAEEATPSVERFAASGAFALTVDPIDGTQLYVNSGSLFAIIVGLFAADGPVYTLKHFPAIGWTHRIVGTTHEASGESPRVALPIDARRVIVYSKGDPLVDAPSLAAELAAAGYRFQHTRALTDAAGATTLFLAGLVGGYFISDPPVVDGFVAYHYAKATSCRLLTSLPTEGAMVSAMVIGPYGVYLPGFYCVLRDPVPL